MKKKLTIKTIKDHIAFINYGTDANDLKIFAFGHTEFFRKLNFFLKKSVYADYLKEDILNQISLNEFKLNIEDYWQKFQSNIKFLKI